MVSVSVRVTLNRSAMIRVVGPMTNAAAERAAYSVQSRARANLGSLGRVNTGRLRNSIQVRRANTANPLSAAYAIGSPLEYAKYQEFGTRPHGPRSAPFMVFRIRGRGKLIFAKWVRGVTPGQFMYNAIRRTKVADFIGNN